MRRCYGAKNEANKEAKKKKKKQKKENNAEYKPKFIPQREIWMGARSDCRGRLERLAMLTPSMAKIKRRKWRERCSGGVGGGGGR